MTLNKEEEQDEYVEHSNHLQVKVKIKADNIVDKIQEEEKKQFNEDAGREDKEQENNGVYNFALKRITDPPEKE